MPVGASHTIVQHFCFTADLLVYGALPTGSGEGFAPQAQTAGAPGAYDLLVNIAYFGGGR